MKCLMKPHKIAFFPILFLVFLALNPARADEVTVMLNHIKPAVVLIEVKVEGEVRLPLEGGGVERLPISIGGTGSGFIIHPRGYVVTNGHVVQLYYEKNEEKLKELALRQALLQRMGITDPTGQLTQEQQNQLNQLFKQLRFQADIVLRKSLIVYLPNGFYFAGEVKAYSPPIAPYYGKLISPGVDLEGSGESGKDIAILKIEGKNFPTMPLGDSDMIQLGEPLWVIGYPGAVLQHSYISKISAMLTPTVTKGTISGTKVDVKGMPVIQTDAQVTWGNSGGPAVNQKGEAIGVATFISIIKGQAIQGFNFLVPINTVKEFIRASGVPLGEESLFNKFWYEAIDLYQKRDYDGALEALSKVQKILPNFPDVLSLQQKIVELKDKEDRIKFRNRLIIGAGIGLIILVGLVLFFTARRKKQTGAIPAEEVRRSTEKVTTSPTAVEGGHLFGELVVEAGAVKGKSFPVSSKGLVIGRDPGSADILVQDERVSRRHAWIGPEGGDVVVRDLDSSNGTFLNSSDNRITKAVLKEGDRILLGQSGFAVFRYTRQ